MKLFGYAMNKIHFVTYANDKFALAKRRLLKQAQEFGVFDTVTGYGPEDLPEEFKLKYCDILKEQRGGGYWIWRPYVFQNILHKIDDGEIVLFLDAGCNLNDSGKANFFKYLKLFESSEFGLISFKYTSDFFQQKKWTVKEIFDYFDVAVNSPIGNSPQYSGGIIFLKKNPHSLEFVRAFYDVLDNAPYLFTDKFNTSDQQIESFRENRHDQSISTMLRYINGTLEVSIDELSDPIHSPFLITRSKK